MVTSRTNAEKKPKSEKRVLFTRFSPFKYFWGAPGPPGISPESRRKFQKGIIKTHVFFTFAPPAGGSKSGLFGTGGRETAFFRAVFSACSHGYAQCACFRWTAGGTKCVFGGAPRCSPFLHSESVAAQLFLTPPWSAEKDGEKAKEGKKRL